MNSISHIRIRGTVSGKTATDPTMRAGMAAITLFCRGNFERIDQGLSETDEWLHC